MNRLEQLHDAGVSIWLDTLSRELLDSGAFAALIAGSAVTGATSNPTIFAKVLRAVPGVRGSGNGAGWWAPSELTPRFCLVPVEVRPKFGAGLLPDCRTVP
jgi:hypothetical protein